MKKTLIFVTIIIASMMLCAQRPGHGHRGGRGRGPKPGAGVQLFLNDRLLEEVGVSERTRASIRRKKHEIRQKMEDIQFKIRELRIASRDEMKKKQPNIKLLKANAHKTAELQKQRILLLENFKIDVLVTLTPEQRALIVQKMKERRERFMRRMGGVR